jgi:hypothetical protein
MAHTHCIARKSTSRLPVGQLAPQNVLQPQESQPDIPQQASPEEEPFEIELVVPESPTAQDMSAEEQQPEDHGTEDKANKEHPPRAILNPRRCTEMLTRWSPSGLNLRSSPADFELCWSTWASPPLPVQGRGSPAFRASGVQGHRRDLFWI